MASHPDDIVLPVRITKSFDHALGKYVIEVFALEDTEMKHSQFTARTVDANDAEQMFQQLRKMFAAIYATANREILDKLS